LKNLISLVIMVLCAHFTAICSPHISTDSSDFAQIRSNLYIVSPDGSTVLMDGNLTQYSSAYSNALDGMDARKLSNPSENWGLLRNNTVYVIERRHTIEGNDSIFFKMWNMRIITYRVEFVTTNLNAPHRQGILEDKYLNTTTHIDLNGTTDVDFSVTSDPDSKATDRFRIIFSDSVPEATPLPHLTALGAFESNNQIQLIWQTENENNLLQFEIEKSLDKINFIKLNTLKAFNTINSYHWVDANPRTGNNYYRIASVDINGNVSYSNIMTVNHENGNPGIRVYPNPASTYNFNLQMVNQQPGNYEIKLFNSTGQLFMTKSIQYSGGSTVEKLQPQQNIPPGIYRLEIKMPGNLTKVINVVF